MHFSPWESIDRNILLDCAKAVGKFSVAELEALIRDHVQNIQIELLRELDAAHRRASDQLTLTTQNLLDVPGCLLVARFKLHPFTDTDLEQASGMTRLIKVDSFWVPLVLVFPDASDTLVEHESIHACQYKYPNSYPLTENERLLLVSKGLKQLIDAEVSQDGCDVVDLVARVCAFKVWTEIEAYQFSYGQVGLEADELIDRVLTSASPLRTMDQILGLGEGAFQAQDKLRGFCDQMERDHPWIGELVSKISGKPSSLYYALEAIHLEQEMEELDF
jgi:hypothetical protein